MTITSFDGSLMYEEHDIKFYVEVLGGGCLC